MLFRRNVSGCRVVDNTSSSNSSSSSLNIHPNKPQHQEEEDDHDDDDDDDDGDGDDNRNFKKITNISGYEFQNWGSHCNNYPYSYFTIACTIGITEKDINLFIDRLQKCLYKYYHHKDYKNDKNDKDNI